MQVNPIHSQVNDRHNGEQDLQDYQESTIAQSHHHCSHESEALQILTENQSTYRSALSEALHQSGSLTLEMQEQLQALKKQYELNDTDVTTLEKIVIAGYDQHKQHYQEEFTRIIHQKTSLSRETFRQLQRLQSSLGLSDRVIADIEQIVITTCCITTPSQVLNKTTEEPTRSEDIAKPLLHPTGWLRILAGTLTTVSATSIAMPLYNQWQADQTSQAEFTRIRGLATTDAPACVEAAQRFPQDSRWYSDVQKLSRRCKIAQDQGRMRQAKTLANQGKLRDAIATISQVSATSATRLDAKRTIDVWAERILKIASRYYEKGEFRTAIAIAQAVPKHTPIYQVKQIKITRWNRDWKSNQTHFANAKKARLNHQWATVIQQATQITHPYLKKQADPLISEALQAQRAMQPQFIRPSIATVKLRDVKALSARS